MQTRAPYNFPRVRIKAGATAVRLLCAERFLQTHNHQQIIESARFEAQGEQDRVLHPWHDWYYRGIIATPYATRQELAPAGNTPARVREVAAMLHPKLPPEKRRKKHTAIREQLIRDLDPDFLPRIRSKLQRWRLPAYPWLLAERAYRILQAAFALAWPKRTSRSCSMAGRPSDGSSAGSAASFAAATPRRTLWSTASAQ